MSLLTASSRNSPFSTRACSFTTRATEGEKAADRRVQGRGAMRVLLLLTIASLASSGCNVVSDSSGEWFGTDGKPVRDGAVSPEDDPGSDDFKVPPQSDVGAISDAACAKATVTAQAVPLDIFVMLDQSGSMKDPTGSGGSKWEAVKAAFKGFISDPATKGLGMGLAYFGHTNFFSEGKSSCNVSDYAKADVEIAELPGVASAITSSLALHRPFTDTPTGPALQGALQHARAWQTAHPGHVVAVVLATDGMPTACSPSDIPGIAALAATELSGKPSIRTYVIGVLSSDDIAAAAGSNLDTISKAGNGEPAFVINSAADVTKSFVSALSKIRGTALGCEYTVPSGTGADYDKVNVVVVHGSAGETLPYVETADKCDAVKGGWYYDVPPSKGTPKKILTCNATCKSLSIDATGKIEIQVGCATLRPK